MKSLEVVLLFVLGGLAAIFLFVSKDYSSTALLFPRVISIVSLIFFAVLMFRGRSLGTEEKFSNNVSSVPTLRFAVIGLQAAYIVLIYVIGFVAATLAFLVVFPIQLRYRRWGVVLTHAVALTLVLTASFIWLFNVQLPAGAVWELW